MSADKFLTGRGRLGSALALALLLGAAESAPVGEPVERRPRVARRVKEPRIAFGNPLGVAFSPRAQFFVVAPAEGPSKVSYLTPTADRTGIDTLELAGTDALNLAFDAHRGRLLALSRRCVLALSADESGRLKRGAAARFDVHHLGLQDPGGLTVDPRPGTPFVLDRALPRLVRVEPTVDGGLDAAAISYVELYEVPTEASGLAFEPGSGHLFLLNGSQELMEVSGRGGAHCDPRCE